MVEMQRTDPYFVIKARILYGLQIVNLIGASATFLYFFAIKEASNESKPVRAEWLWVYCCSPALIMVAVLIEAFWHIRNIRGNLTISRRQVSL